MRAAHQLGVTGPGMVKNVAWTGLVSVGLCAGACQPHAHTSGLPAAPAGGGPVVAPATMARVGTVDERYQSYNVEMLEVTGGKFWKPYGPELDALLGQKALAADAGGKDTPAGMNPGLYEYRPPIDLGNPRLRTLAAALGPAYVRVSGTWANTTYFAPSAQAPATPPVGFMGVLTRPQWKGVVDFSRAVDAKIVTSFAISAGTRDASGAWTPAQARAFMEHTKALGGRIAAAELMNEPNLAAMGGAPAGYGAAGYARDFKAFRAFAKQADPGMLILGPGSSGETDRDAGVAYSATGKIRTRDMLAASGRAIDAFSYHHYGACSLRCAAMGLPQTDRGAALSEGWLARTDEALSFYRALRDDLEPGRPFWLTETADAACGGNPWARTFLDTFRYLDQLGRLAKQDVRVVMHNTLVASDYGLLDDKTLAPKPNYWGALLWRRLMGTTVLESGVPIQQGFHVYAHNLRGVAGGVALLAINTDRSAAHELTIPVASERYTLSASDLESKTIMLNGAAIALGRNDELPSLVGVSTPSGTVSLGPATITFFAMPRAGNPACR
jgi:heparanase